MFRKKGIINLLKPPGISSFKAIGRLKKILDHPKAGHTGTLDPRAAGVLPVCFGRATKIIPFLPESKKEYIAELTLGKITNTLDGEGKIINEDNSFKNISKNDIHDILPNFIGEIEQVPPMYSAIKKNGQKLYKLARKGKRVKREPRNVKIHNIDIISYKSPRLKLKITCSKGTYIRSLARDIGNSLNCGAYLSFLLRTKSGPFIIKDSTSYKEMEYYVNNNKDDFIYSLDWPLDYPRVKLKKRGDKKAINGAELSYDDLQYIPEFLKENIRIMIHSSKGKFISINEVVYKKDVSQNILKAVRVFV